MRIPMIQKLVLVRATIINATFLFSFSLEHVKENCHATIFFIIGVSPNGLVVILKFPALYAEMNLGNPVLVLSISMPV